MTKENKIELKQVAVFNLSNQQNIERVIVALGLAGYYVQYLGGVIRVYSDR